MELATLAVSGLALVLSVLALVYTRREADAAVRSAEAAEVSAEESRKAAAAAQQQAMQAERPRLEVRLERVAGAADRPLVIHNPGPVDVALSVEVVDGDVALWDGRSEEPCSRVDMGSLRAGASVTVTLERDHPDESSTCGLRLELAAGEDRWSQGVRLPLDGTPGVWVI